jgi:fatty-acyl-CoA synthase
MAVTLPDTARLAAAALRAGVRSGLIAPVRPDRAVRMAGAALRLAPGIGLVAALDAARHPERVAVIDDEGSLTFAQLDAQVGRLAAALGDRFGVGPDRGLAVMCRNHRGFVIAALAGSRLGADLLLLNTDFSAPQLAQTLAPHRLGAIVHDEEFAQRFDEAAVATPRVLAEPASFEELAAGATRAATSRRAGRIVLLTSGTTGAPKGAPRSISAVALASVGVSALDSMRLRSGEPVLVAPPFFHGFGLAGLGTALALGSPVVSMRRFDAQRVLELIDRDRVAVLFAVPVMLKRMLAVPEAQRRALDTSSLRVALSAAAPLSASLASEFMDVFGDVVFNGYGSTEVGVVALATPADLRAAPGTVGRPPDGITVRILDGEDRAVAAGETGRIFVGSSMLFEGYTGGGGKEMVGSAMSTGDRGHFDEDGRLFIDGREDDMIVSGGENVFPGEVEEALARHPAVADVAVIGVDDEDFGQRLAAYVVAAPGARPTADELKAHVKAQLARYKVPRDVHFLDELPRNPTGKLLRKALASGDGRAQDA